MTFERVKKMSNKNKTLDPIAAVRQALLDAKQGITPMRRSHLNAIEKHLEEQFSDELAAIRHSIDTRPEEFMQLVCEAALGISREGVDNLFARTGDGRATSDLGQTVTRPEMAKAILAKLKKIPPYTDEKYISLKQFIEKNWSVRPYFFSPSFTSTDRYALIVEFYRNFEDDFDFAVRSVSETLSQGVPLYSQNELTQVFEAVPYDDEEYIYIRKKTDFGYSERTHYFPNWANRYYVQQDHLKAHRVFFSGFEGDQDEAAILKNAFLRHIGFENYGLLEASTKRGPSRRHKTKLLSLVDNVIERYYGANFDPMIKDTWPPQETIKSWLKSEFGLSDREATSVDIIARPDNIRGK